MTNELSYLNRDLLSQILCISEKELIILIKKAPKLYFKSYKITERKKRDLNIPHKILKNHQHTILHNILHKIPLHPFLYGGPGTSTKLAASPHVRKPLLVTADIKNFFPSVKAHHVRIMFLRYGASVEIADTLTRLVTHQNFLPQGAPTSPAIGRLILQPFAEELESLVKGIPHTSGSIYVDDIILSGPVGIKRILPILKKMLIRHGFRLNNKTRYLYRKEEQVCLNIRVNDGIAPPSTFIRKLKELSKILPKSDPRLKGKQAYVRFLNE